MTVVALVLPEIMAGMIDGVCHMKISDAPNLERFINHCHVVETHAAGGNGVELGDADFTGGGEELDIGAGMMGCRPEFLHGGRCHDLLGKAHAGDNDALVVFSS